jgi:tripartite-type tricarboxylate transporter receptor subunit TctC
MRRKQSVVCDLSAVSAAVLGIAIGCTSTAYGAEASFPKHPIRIVVPFTAGGAADVTARLVGDKLSAAWKQPVVVENRPSAGGIAGTDIVAKAAPDGYTLGMISVSHALKPGIYAKLPYDTVKDFTYLTMSANVGLVMVVSNSVAANSIQELIALAKREPGKLAYASSGAGSSGHLATELFLISAGIRMVHVPYKGSTQAHPDLLSGRVQVMTDTILAVSPHIKAGRVKALGVTAKSRSALLPDVPSISDAIPGYEAGSWGGVVAPARLPADIKQKLHDEIVRALTTPDVRDRLASLGAEVVANSSVEFSKFVQAEIRKWGAVTKAAGIKVE